MQTYRQIKTVGLGRVPSQEGTQVDELLNSNEPDKTVVTPITQEKGCDTWLLAVAHYEDDKSA